MQINGQGFTPLFGAVCGGLWLILLAAILFLTLKIKPTSQNGRRWKAAVLVGGLPVLGVTFLLPVILVITIFVKTGFSNFELQSLPIVISGLFQILACMGLPMLGMAVIATIGIHWKLRTSMDYWTDKIIPPSKNEKPSIHTWL